MAKDGISVLLVQIIFARTAILIRFLGLELGFTSLIFYISTFFIFFCLILIYSCSLEPIVEIATPYGFLERKSSRELSQREN